MIGGEGGRPAVAKAHQSQSGQALPPGPELQEVVALEAAFGTPCSLQAEDPERLIACAVRPLGSANDGRGTPFGQGSTRARIAARSEWQAICRRKAMLINGAFDR